MKCNFFGGRGWIRTIEAKTQQIYSAYEKKAYKVICVQTEEKNLSQSVSYWDFFMGGTRISSCQYKMCFFF